MSEMVERVAKALAIAHGDAWENVPDDKSQWIERRGKFGGRFRGVDENFKSDYLDEAGVAIKTMRDPTLFMLRHGDRIFDDRNYDRTDDLREAWRAMIDAALVDDLAPPSRVQAVGE